MRLFTRTDLERCARLTLGIYHATGKGSDELAISQAVTQITDETQPVFTKDALLKAVERALDDVR